MSPLTLLELGKTALSWLFDILKLLLDPKVLLLMAAAGSYGFLRGCEDERGRFDVHLAQDKERADLAAAQAKARDERNRQIKEGIDRASTTSLADLRIQRDAAQRELRERPFRIRVVFPPGPARPVQPGTSDGERRFLADVYSGETLCYGRDYLVDGIQRIVGGALQHAIERTGRLVEPAIVALDDAKWWGEWGRQVGACKAPGVP